MNPYRPVAISKNDPISYLVFLLHFVPKNALSWLCGVAARIRWPKPIAGWICGAFVKAFKIDMSESENSLENFQSIEGVFTRSLKPGSRPIEASLVSPADGFLASSNKIEADSIVQAKGINYSASELVFGESLAGREHDFAWQTTVYLAPHNYHRVHSCVSGKLLRSLYIPGELWPVNLPAVSYVPQLFTRNERLTFEIEAENGGRIFLVMVGALNVGRIASPYFDYISNNSKRQLGARPSAQSFSPAKNIAAGSELGTFMLGSTVILIFDQKAYDTYKPSEASDRSVIKMGQNLS